MGKLWRFGEGATSSPEFCTIYSRPKKKRMLSCKVTIIPYIIISISSVIKLILSRGKPFAKSARDFCICVTIIQEKDKM